MSPRGLALPHSPPWNSGATAGHYGVKAVILQQRNPTEEGKMGFFETHLALGLCIILELILHKQGRVMWVEQRLFTTCSCGSVRLGTHTLCSVVSCPVLAAPKVWWRV